MKFLWQLLFLQQKQNSGPQTEKNLDLPPVTFPSPTWRLLLLLSVQIPKELSVTTQLRSWRVEPSLFSSSCLVSHLLLVCDVCLRMVFRNTLSYDTKEVTGTVGGNYVTFMRLCLYSLSELITACFVVVLWKSCEPVDSSKSHNCRLGKRHFITAMD